MIDSGLLAARILLLVLLGAPAVATALPYETDVTAEGDSAATASSSANVAESVVEAFGSAPGVVGHSTAYASSESTLEVRGGALDSIVLVDITYSIEVGTWKSADLGVEPFSQSTASANGLIDIADVLNSEASVWEAELDLHTTGVVTSDEDDVVSVVATVSLLSGHDYIVALEAFAEAWAIDGGWARAEAIVDPVFAINTGQAGWESLSLNHITPGGSDLSSVPEPTTLSLLGLGLVGIGLWRRAG